MFAFLEQRKYVNDVFRGYEPQTRGPSDAILRLANVSKLWSLIRFSLFWLLFLKIAARKILFL
jgi:hypothetical protein